jgi:hypothetical protein
MGYRIRGRARAQPGPISLSNEYPNANETGPNSIIDTSIMKRIEQSGFIKAFAISEALGLFAALSVDLIVYCVGITAAVKSGSWFDRERAINARG